jgi:membrane protein YqaA with SNARE-associated domain
MPGSELLENWISPEWGLWGVFLSSFLGATLLPGGSEAVLFGVLRLHPGLLWAALLLATLGNTLGGMVSWLMGRAIKEPEKIRAHKSVAWVEKHGAPMLLLAWTPLLGDVLCLAAGWLRVNPWWSAFYMALGKFGRYWLVTQAL